TWLSPGCGVSTTITVPKGLTMLVRTTSGDIVAEEITEGVLTLFSVSGDIRGNDLGAVDEFSADTGSGDISATCAAQPFGVKVTTDSGDITATLPAGERSYSVIAKSKSGEVSSSVDDDTSGSGFVRATSGSGEISL